MASPRLPPKLNDFKALRHVHIIGVGGTLMGAFAAFLRRRGIRVTGSDGPIYPPMSDVLAAAGIELSTGYRAETLAAFTQKPDLVVIGNVIQASNPEARAAIDGGYAYTSLPEAMEKLLLPATRNLVVAGTHGKTTTSSLLAFVLRELGQDPSYFIGGVSLDLPHSFQVGDGKLFVLEGDEYDTAFWDKVPKFNHYLPDEAILTSVEYDHADIYPDLNSVIKAFEGLMDRVRPAGAVIACTDYANVRQVLRRAKCEVISYGSGTGSREIPRFTPGQIRMEGETTVFDVLEHGKKLTTVRLSVPGHHNALNATAVVALCVARLGLPANAVGQALGRFRGVKRRQEVRGEPRGILIIDDFAHHPTAVRETLAALKAKYPGRRLVTAFEPRSATSRRKIFQKDYAEAFDQAAQIFIASPYDQSRISSGDQFSSEELVADLKARGRLADLLEPIVESSGGATANVPPAVKQLTECLKPGDVLAVLSNGGFGGLIPKLIQSLD